MPATYNEGHPTNKDHVRFLIGDTNVSDALLSDEQIESVLEEETATGKSLKYFAAARCLSVLLVRWSSAGQGITRKQVSRLSISYGNDVSAQAALEKRICELRERGAFLMSPRPYVLRMLSVALLFAALSTSPARAQFQFFWLQFLQPVEEEADLPACTDGSVEENRARFVREPDAAIYFCPDGGGTWVQASGAGGGASTFDAIESGTNTTATMTVDTGASVVATGSGAIVATDLSGTDVIGGTEVDESTLVVPDASIAATIARDTEVTAAINAAGGIDLTCALGSCDVDAAVARDSEVTAAVAALSTVYQPLDTDLTAVAAISTTSFGRSLLALADQAALLSAAGAAASSHTHGVGDITGEHAGTDLAADLEEEAHGTEHNDGGNDELALDGSQVTTGTVADARIASTIARDTELPNTYATFNAPNGTDPVAGSTTDTLNLTGSTVLITGTVGADILDFEVASYVLDSSNMSDADWGDFTISSGLASIDANAVALTTDTTGPYAAGDAEAGAALSGDSATAFFSAGAVEDARIDAAIHRDSETKDGDLVSFDDGDSNFAATDVDEAIEELDDDNASGPNASDGKMSWTQLVDVPAGFADETDDGAGGGGSMPQRCYVWPAGATWPIQVSDSVAPLALAQGTNLDHHVERYDDTTDECRGWALLVPPDVDTSASATFGRYWYAVTASTNTVVWDVRSLARSEGEQIDTALVLDFAAADAGDSTQGELTHTTWTETLSNLGWTANELALGEACRDANGTNGTDNLVGDAASVLFYICIPEAE